LRFGFLEIVPPRDRLASVIRWSMLTFGVLLTWLGSTIAFRQLGVGYPDVLAGSTTVLLFVYPPDLACYLRQGGERIVGSEDRKEED